MKKIIIYTGKGGVGKSSISSATAIKSARENNKTILLSLDRAHSLSDIFETKPSDEIVNLRDKLDLLEINTEKLLIENFPYLKENFNNLYTSPGLNTTLLDDKFSLPGLENLINLIKIKDIYDNYDYDNIIVDCPPTGSSLALLQLPELLSWYLEKFFPIGKNLVRVLNPIAKHKYKTSLPKKEALDDVEKIYYKILDLQSLLKNKKQTCIRLVSLAEKMVVEETKRSYMYLNLYDYNVDRIFINRIYQGYDDNDFIKKSKNIQAKYIKILEEIFSDIKIDKIKWYPEQIHGIDSINKMLNDLNETDDLLTINTNKNSLVYQTYEKGYILEIPYFKAFDDDYKIEKIDKDLIITMKNFKRIIPLPNILYESVIEKIKFSSNLLKVYFSNNKESLL
ncbi:MAG: TRC40/GET3/ArsA family transport-energizing ATPase [Peptoniphilaceae bacterium]|nr:TRC40/GET3/ArsA family transport-energizing ATPase [Peptoniphilaceae bacterium]MDY6019177.1 TRC40/GET3/ArsA family transport-energizing ATPase [Anaerococcus sp.]